MVWQSGQHHRKIVVIVLDGMTIKPTSLQSSCDILHCIQSGQLPYNLPVKLAWLYDHQEFPTIFLWCSSWYDHQANFPTIFLWCSSWSMTIRPTWPIQTSRKIVKLASWYHEIRPTSLQSSCDVLPWYDNQEDCRDSWPDFIPWYDNCRPSWPDCHTMVRNHRKIVGTVGLWYVYHGTSQEIGKLAWLHTIQSSLDVLHGCQGTSLQSSCDVLHGMTTGQLP